MGHFFKAELYSVGIMSYIGSKQLLRLDKHLVSQQPSKLVLFENAVSCPHTTYTNTQHASGVSSEISRIVTKVHIRSSPYILSPA